MSNELVKRQQLSVEQIAALSKDLSQSSLLPAELKGKEANIMFAIMTGAELGLSPMASIRGIHVVEGRPTLAADTMLAVILNSGAAEYFELVESTARQATYRTKRVGSKQEVVYTYTLDDAHQAKLLKSGSGWEKHPKNMLRARCISMLARVVYPDILAGIYTPEEIKESRNGDVIEAEYVTTSVGTETEPEELPPEILELAEKLKNASSQMILADLAKEIAAMKLSQRSGSYAALLKAYQRSEARLAVEQVTQQAEA